MSKHHVLIALTMLGLFFGAGTNAFGADADEGPRVVVSEIRDKARARVSMNGDQMVVDVRSPTGIGDLRLELNSGEWPKKLVVRLEYEEGKPIAVLEGHSVALESSTDETDKSRNPLTTKRSKPGQLDVLIPRTPMKVIHVQWIDYYRH